MINESDIKEDTEDFTYDKEVEEVLSSVPIGSKLTTATICGRNSKKVADHAESKLITKSENKHVATGKKGKRKRTSPDCDNESNQSFSTSWSGLWREGRKSAFSPYRPTPLLTNLSRGNILANTKYVEPEQVSLFQRAAQGEITEQLINSEIPEEKLKEKDSSGFTPLMWTAYYGQVPTLQLLLSHGADPNDIGPDGCSALLLACSQGHAEAAKCLIMAGADVNHYDDTCSTALMYSCHGNHPQCVHLLLGEGADFLVQNLNDMTAYRIAVKNRSKLAQLVIEKHLFGS